MKFAFAILATVLLALPAYAQDDFESNSCFSIGMSFNEDSMGVALGYYNTSFKGGFGFYSNAAIDFTAPVDDIETQEDRWFPWHYSVDQKFQNYIFNGGFAFRASKPLILYAGGGLAVQDSLTRWQSEVSSLNYWARDEEYEYSGNFNAGLIFKPTDSFGIDLGFNSASTGGYVSVAIGF